MKIVISSGHGLYVRGASGILDEVDEARRVVEALADELRQRGVDVVTYHDDVSTSQNENLNRIVDFHNSQQRDCDVSIHFNAYEQVSKPMGTECLYVTQADVAAKVSEAIAMVGLIDRGPKKRTDLFFLNETEMPAILIEVCFVDSEADAAIYEAEFDAIIGNLATLVEVTPGPLPPPERPDREALFMAEGSCSWFGGPDDMGVSPSEGLAFIYDYGDAPHLFLDEQPCGTTGLARRLNPDVPYIACRWDYDVTPKEMLDDHDKYAVVVSKATGRRRLAWPSDWGPHEDTGRVADLSPGLMEALDLTTDDEVIVRYPVSVKHKPRLGG